MERDILGYIIMRKDDPITYAEFSSDGTMINYSRDIMNPDLAPIQDAYQGEWLKLWWKERSIPIEQDNIEKFLRQNGFTLPSDFLIKNLGLSLTDYYWLKPVDSPLIWEDVNLFDNDFKGNLLDWERNPAESDNLGTTPHYSPNGSLQGTIEKSWVINNGERYLIKGNHGKKSAESINETIACEIHKRQGWKNYCDYGLIKISGKEYAYGCYSKAFTSQERELVSAWALYTNEKKPNGTSTFDHLLQMCNKYKMNVDKIRAGLDYQILTDFIMSAHDRHLSNIAFLRDANSLEFIGLAPIFDSGGSMFAGKDIPKNEKELLDIDTHSFVSKEKGLLSLVSDRDMIDLTKLPPASFIRESYQKDPAMDEKDIKNISHWYERKIELCRDYQLGKDVFSRVYIGTRPIDESVLSNKIANAIHEIAIEHAKFPEETDSVEREIYRQLKESADKNIKEGEFTEAVKSYVALSTPSPGEAFSNDKLKKAAARANKMDEVKNTMTSLIANGDISSARARELIDAHAKGKVAVFLKKHVDSQEKERSGPSRE